MFHVQAFFCALLVICANCFVRFWLPVWTVLCASGHQCEQFCALLVTSANSFVRFWLPVRNVLSASGYQCELFCALLVTSANCFVRFWLPVRTVLCASGYQCEQFPEMTPHMTLRSHRGPLMTVSSHSHLAWQPLSPQQIPPPPNKATDLQMTYCKPQADKESGWNVARFTADKRLVPTVWSSTPTPTINIQQTLPLRIIPSTSKDTNQLFKGIIGYLFQGTANLLWCSS